MSRERPFSRLSSRQIRTYLAGRPLEFGAHADNEYQITRTENTGHVWDEILTSWSASQQASTPQKPTYRVPRSRWPLPDVRLSVCRRQGSLKIVQRNRSTRLVFFAISRYDDVDHVPFFSCHARGIRSRSRE